MSNNDNKKNLKMNIILASKWSAITEVLSKIMIPITNMVLARVLVPEAFGVIAIVTMITSFADMFTNTGFQKYLIQHEYEDSQEEMDSISVAFWANLIISLIMWVLVCLFSKNIAKALGDIELSLAISVASIQILISSFASIQIAIYRRNLDFKTLFIIRIITALVPAVITIPLALYGFGYWALIIGNIIGQSISAIMMTIKSKWKPKFSFKVFLLKKMLKYSIWSTMDSVVLWLENWVDAFVVGNLISTYYLGVYKTSVNTVNGILGIVIAAVGPVLFSVLSRYQNDKKMFKKVFINAQKVVAYILLPMGIGIFLYSDLVTQIFLGSQWSEASKIIGIWALVMSIVITIGNFNSDALRSVGHPDISFIIGLITSIFTILVCLISIKMGFWILVYARAFVTFLHPIISYKFMKKFVDIGYLDMMNAILKPSLCTLIMGVVSYFLKINLTSLAGNLASVMISVIVYFLAVYIISKDDFYEVLHILVRK